MDCSRETQKLAVSLEIGSACYKKERSLFLITPGDSTLIGMIIARELYRCRVSCLVYAH